MPHVENFVRIDHPIRIGKINPFSLPGKELAQKSLEDNHVFAIARIHHMELGALDRLLPDINLGPFRGGARLLYQLDLEMVLKQYYSTVRVRILRIVGAERNRNGWEMQGEGRRVIGVEILGWVQGQSVFNVTAR